MCVRARVPYFAKKSRELGAMSTTWVATWVVYTTSRFKVVNASVYSTVLPQIENLFSSFWQSSTEGGSAGKTGVGCTSTQLSQTLLLHFSSQCQR